MLLPLMLLLMLREGRDDDDGWEDGTEEEVDEDVGDNRGDGGLVAEESALGSAYGQPDERAKQI